MSDPILRRLVRDQWVRIHGTPRITVLAGGADARTLWARWAAITGAEATLLEGDLDRDLRSALAQASADPTRPIAVLASPDEVTRWRAGRTDRMAAMLEEGLLRIDSGPGSAGASIRGRDEIRDSSVAPDTFDARSVAEATLFEALEATPATTGRFELNASLAVRFGPTAAEVDLLSRTDAIAVEIDGYHHFTDADHYRRDRRKDLLLQTQGLLVIRLLAEDVLRDPREGVQMVCRALAYRMSENR